MTTFHITTILKSNDEVNTRKTYDTTNANMNHVCRMLCKYDFHIFETIKSLLKSSMIKIWQIICIPKKVLCHHFSKDS